MTLPWKAHSMQSKYHGCHPDTCQAAGVGWQELYELPQGQIKSPSPRKEESLAAVSGRLARKKLCRKDLGPAT